LHAAKYLISTVENNKQANKCITKAEKIAATIKKIKIEGRLTKEIIEDCRLCTPLTGADITGMTEPERLKALSDMDQQLANIMNDLVSKATKSTAAAKKIRKKEDKANLEAASMRMIKEAEGLKKQR